MVKVAVMVIGVLVSAVAIRVAMRAADSLRLVDHPGQHKQHDHSTPFVGGIGLFLAAMSSLLVLLWMHPSLRNEVAAVALAASMMFFTGLADDVWRLGFRVRFVIQSAAALIMAIGAGVALHDLGGLFFNTSTPLGLFAIPFTVFATVGVINALNMIDGMDGMAGSLAFMSLLVISAVALGAGKVEHGLLSLGLLGGIGGFLYYNLRHGRQRRARVFMGDNGSMLLGLMLALLLIDLSQGPDAGIQPVAALWLIAVPLMDTVGVMLRRIWMGKSPFTPDRHHLHHLLQSAGFRVDDIVAIIAGLQLALAAGGVLALELGASEGVMFVGFLALFALYFVATVRCWRVVPALRRLHSRLGLLPAASCGIYFGHSAAVDAGHLVEAIARELGQTTSFRVRVFERTAPEDRCGQRYALVDIQLDDELASVDAIRRYARLVRLRLRKHQHMRVRPLIARSSANDPRIGRGVEVDNDLRRQDRRNPHGHVLVMEVDAFVDGGVVRDVAVVGRRPNREAASGAGRPTIPAQPRTATAGAVSEIAAGQRH
ncbi:undecaprenyl/decaprenyl-phosphate alpha-N-acetylglucosaminyl 1-phosphate transferase [Thauera sp. UPWRP]|nr:undecaprenyl/decaprenyl-phosphate alpha-N-acetylglucosaminyl 1-phosphate transferase [Thauera sp. UPWRP]